MARSRAKELYEDYAAKNIASAVSFYACLYPDRHTREAPTLAEIRRLAQDELAPLATHGRRPLIYAITATGRAVLVDDTYPETEETKDGEDRNHQ